MTSPARLTLAGTRKGDPNNLHRGRDLILVHLRNTLAELGASRGRQLHCSWLVAEGAVASAERHQCWPMLVLRSGPRVSVSRIFRAQVRQVAWLG